MPLPPAVAAVTDPPGRGTGGRRWGSAGDTARWAARAAGIVGGAYAAVSVYWGLGGTRLLDTVGGSLEAQGRAGGTAVIIALWLAVVLKIVASVLPLVALRRSGPDRRSRAVRAAAWVEAGVLVTYGLVLTGAGLLVQVGAIPTSASADRRALAWHAYLWDPWFLVWGLLVVAALVDGRRRATGRS
ncbi:MAG: DUF3995 domain-containing protein [Actinomycetota bacterium]|nr:DUF3995 domain-containing protein [Actinomycetota bacterium]